MDKQLFESLLISAREGADIVTGRKKPSRVFSYTSTDIKRIREKLGFSQSQFARAFHINLRTLQNWEQARCVPDGAAQVLLKIADKNPTALLNVL